MNKSGFNFRKIIIEAESNSNDEKVSAFVSIDKYIKDRSSRPDFQFNNSLDNSLNDSKSKNQFFEENDNSTVNFEVIEEFVSEVNLLIDEEISEESLIFQEENSIDQLISNEEEKLTSIIEVTSIDEILVDEEKTFFNKEVLIDELSEEEEPVLDSEISSIDEVLEEEQLVESEEFLIDELSEEEEPVLDSEISSIDEVLEEEQLVESEEFLIDELLVEEELLVVNDEVSIDDILEEEEQVSVSKIASIDDLLEDESLVVSEDITIEEVLEDEIVLESEIVSIDNLIEEAEEQVESEEVSIDEILDEETQVVENKEVSIDELQEEDPIIASEIVSIEEELESCEPVIVSEDVTKVEELEINNLDNDKDLKKSEDKFYIKEVESLNTQEFNLVDLIQKEDFQSIFEFGNTLIFPRLGAFTITNEKTGELFFIPYLKHDDNVLNNYISKREGISIEDAKKQISSYVDSIKYNLDNDNQFIFNDFGRLYYDKNKELTFDKNDSKDHLIDLNNTYQDTNIKVEVNEIDSQIIVDDIELISENTSINISENIPENIIENRIHPTEDVVENISDIIIENSTEKYIVETPVETISNNKVNEIIEKLDEVTESTNYEELEISIFNDLNLEKNEPEIIEKELQDSLKQKNTSKSKSKKGILISLVSLSLILVVLSIFFVFITKKNKVSVEKSPEIVSEKQENKSYDKKTKIKEVKNEESVFSDVKEKKQSVENISVTKNIPKNENNFNNTSKVNAIQQTNVVKTKNTVLIPVVKKNPIGLNNITLPKNSLNTKKENVSLPTTNKLNTKNINFDSLKVSPTVRNMIESGYYDVFVDDKQIILKTKSR